MNHEDMFAKIETARTEQNSARCTRFGGGE